MVKRRDHAFSGHTGAHWKAYRFPHDFFSLLNRNAFCIINRYKATCVVYNLKIPKRLFFFFFLSYFFITAMISHRKTCRRNIKTRLARERPVKNILRKTSHWPVIRAGLAFGEPSVGFYRSNSNAGRCKPA